MLPKQLLANSEIVKAKQGIKTIEQHERFPFSICFIDEHTKQNEIHTVCDQIKTVWGSLWCGQ